MAFNSSATPTSATPSNRRKVRAILAAGLVLGVGAAVTLAAWNDSEFVQGNFRSGSFNLEGSTVGAAGEFTDHNAAGSPATLAFALPENLSQNLAPAQTVYSPFWVRLAAGTSTDAALAVTAASGSDANENTNVDNLSYAIFPIADGVTCDAAGIESATVLAEGATLNTAPGDTSITLNKGADAKESGAAVQLCFAVTAGPDLLQGGDSTAAWTLTATSIS